MFGSNRASAGAVLRLTDLVTGIAAAKHGRANGCVTLAFDRVSLSKGIKAFDLLQLESEVVSVGRTSMLVLCRGYTKSLTTGVATPVMKSYVTYVAIGDDMKPTQVGQASFMQCI